MKHGYGVLVEVPIPSTYLVQVHLGYAWIRLDTYLNLKKKKKVGYGSGYVFHLTWVWLFISYVVFSSKHPRFPLSLISFPLAHIHPHCRQCNSKQPHYLPLEQWSNSNQLHFSLFISVSISILLFLVFSLFSWLFERNIIAKC